MASRFPTTLTLLLMLLCVCGPVVAGKSHPVPWQLHVQVIYGEPKGPESLREEIENEILRVLDGEGCYERIRRYSPEESLSEADLLFTLTINELEDERNVETTQAAQLDPRGDPDLNRAIVASLSAEFLMQLDTGEDPTPFRWRRFMLERAHRPILNEDPEYEARYRFIEDMSRSVRKWTCSVSEKSIRRDIRRARERDAN